MEEIFLRFWTLEFNIKRHNKNPTNIFIFQITERIFLGKWRLFRTERNGNNIIEKQLKGLIQTKWATFIKRQKT